LISIIYEINIFILQIPKDFKIDHENGIFKETDIGEICEPIKSLLSIKNNDYNLVLPNYYKYNKSILICLNNKHFSPCLIANSNNSYDNDLIKFKEMVKIKIDNDNDVKFTEQDKEILKLLDYKEFSKKNLYLKYITKNISSFMKEICNNLTHLL
jgi:hypothetical protein